MIVLLSSLALATTGATLIDPSPATSGPRVLVVQTPGFAKGAMTELLDAVEDRGWDPVLLAFDCAGQELGDYSAAITATLAELPPKTPVVAHGIGATAALHSGSASRYVLLAPVLAVVPQVLTRELAERPVPAAVDLGAGLDWNGRNAVTVLLGESELTCLPGPLLAEAASWVGGKPLPIDLPSVQVPVWIGLSGADNLATSEATVGPSRALPQRTLVRLGLNRLDRQDYNHAEMLTSEVPARAAAHALGHP